MTRSRLARTIVLPSSIRRESASWFCVFPSSIPGPPIPLSTLQAASRDASCKTQGQDGVAVSFLVGLFHSLQHAGLSRRTLINAVTGKVRFHFKFLRLDADRHFNFDLVLLRCVLRDP